MARVSDSGKKPECAACKEPINDVVVQAMNKTWHQEHFVCTHCNQPIKSQRFHVKNDKPYCDSDYTKLFTKRCSACNEPITDVVLMALDKPWHKDHFTCASCKVVLTQEGFFENSGKPYCGDCYKNQFSATCKACRKPIAETAVVALGDKYHPNCFSCSRCKKPIGDRTFKMIDGKQVCSRCE